MKMFFPFFPALMRLTGSLLRLKSALLRFISALANNTLLNILAIMNTFFPFFPALVRLISALLGLISALLRLINALLGIECADRYKLPPASCFVLEAASTFLGQHCCSSSGRTGKRAL